MRIRFLTEVTSEDVQEWNEEKKQAAKKQPHQEI